MSYYILPKINNEIIIDPKMQDNCTHVHGKTNTSILSPSLLFYYNDVKEQCLQLCTNENGEHIYQLDQLIKWVNPHEYIFTKLPNSKFSVSKLKPFSNLFYDVLEIIYSLSLFDHFDDTEIQTLHYGSNYLSTIECVNMIREFNQDTHISAFTKEFLNKDWLHTMDANQFDFIYYEFDAYEDPNRYIGWLIQTLYHIFYHQKQNGVAIIKVNDLFYKPVIDVLYILCNSYDKIYLIKPNTSNVVTAEKFIVCKKMNLITNNLSCLYLLTTLEKLLNTLGLPLYTSASQMEYSGIAAYPSQNKQENRFTVSSIIQNEIPYFFLNKVEEFNIIIGQQQLNAMDLLINIMKSKNKEDKIETLKKINIQKCIAWCEKYKIPNNKFTDKTNIFLPLHKTDRDKVLYTTESTEKDKSGGEI